MGYRWVSNSLAVGFFAVSAVSGATGMPAQVKDCEGCHGPDGVSQFSDMPTIAGLSAGSHEDALYAYLDDARPCAKSEYRHGDTSRAATDMCMIVKNLSEDEISALADYFAAKKFVAMAQSFDPEKAKAGEAVHNDGCKRCHSDGGSNPEDDASILAGQPIEYLQRTFEEYRTGKREQPKKMKVKLDELNEADFEALSHYYASQQ